MGTSRERRGMPPIGHHGSVEPVPMQLPVYLYLIDVAGSVDDKQDDCMDPESFKTCELGMCCHMDMW